MDLNLLELILVTVIYYGIIYFSIPYALGEKFANLFKGKDKHKIVHFTSISESTRSSIANFTLWQKWIRFLALPGLWTGFLIRKIAEKLALYICCGKRFQNKLEKIRQSNNVDKLKRFRKKIFSRKLVLMSVIIPFLLALSLWGLEKLYMLCSDLLLYEWNYLIEKIPEGSFVPFKFIASVVENTADGGFNIGLEILKAIAYIPLSTFYFATIFGLFEAVTVSIVKEDNQNNSTDSNQNSLPEKCKETVIEFLKNTRISFTCRISSDNPDEKLTTIQECYYKAMNRKVFVTSSVILILIMMFYVGSTDDCMSLGHALWLFACESGLVQTVISFFVTALINFLTRQAIPPRVRNSISGMISASLSDAVITFVENRGVFDVEEVFSAGNSGSFDETDLF